LGEAQDPESSVFPGLIYKNKTTDNLKEWLKKAGIDRHITFHAFRHTFATLQLTHGTDIYTVSKLLHHKNVQTTQIYARVLNEKKKEAVNRIPKL
jgi:site-specific recombinase XerD